MSRHTRDTVGILECPLGEGCATSVAQIAARGLKPREIALVLLKKWPLDKTENAHRSEKYTEYMLFSDILY